MFGNSHTYKFFVNCLNFFQSRKPFRNTMEKKHDYNFFYKFITKTVADLGGGAHWTKISLIS